MKMQKEKYLGFFIVLFVIFWFFGPLFSIDKNENKVPLTVENYDFNSRILKNNFSETVRFGEIFINSFVVGIEYASLETPGFITLIDQDYRIIGVSKFLPEGVSNNFAIILAKPLKKGDYYGAKIYQDNGNKTFSPKEDVSYVNSENNSALIAGTFLVK